MLSHHLIRALTLALCASALACTSARAQNAADLVKAELLAEPAAIMPGEPFTVGIKLSMKEHWHTYWRNPGDSGEPTQVTWKLPQGFAAGDLQWPAPSLIRVGPSAGFGYEGEAILLARVTPPRDVRPGTTVNLAADVGYVVCEKICIPGEAQVSLSLPVSEPGAPPQANAVFDAARGRLPQPSPWSATFVADEKTITLSLRARDLRGDAIRSATFFPYDNTLIENAARQVLQADGQTTRLTIERSQIAKSAPARFDGVLVLEEDIGGKIAAHAFAIEAAPSAASAAGEGGMTLLYAVMSALLAGIILNLMPCVFPVLSIKILHLTQHTSEPPHRVRLHGVAYALGILACFTILAGVLHALRAGGAEIGWGFQLQSPLMVASSRVHPVRAGIEPVRHSDHRHVADARRRQPPAAAGRPARAPFSPACWQLWWRRPAPRPSWARRSALHWCSRLSSDLPSSSRLGLGSRCRSWCSPLSPACNGCCRGRDAGWKR